MPAYPTAIAPTNQGYYPPQQIQPLSYQQQFQPPMPQYQPPMYGQTHRPATLNGRTVTSVDEITPSEVPMDGSVSFFPTSDYSAVYAKAWNSDGTMKTFKFVPEVVEPVEPEEEPVDTGAVILERLDNIEKMLASSTAKPTTTRQAKTTAPKEG